MITNRNPVFSFLPPRLSRYSKSMCTKFSLFPPILNIWVYLCIPMLIANTTLLLVSVYLGYVLIPRSASTLSWHLFLLFFFFSQNFSDFSSIFKWPSEALIYNNKSMNSKARFSEFKSQKISNFLILENWLYYYAPTLLAVCVCVLYCDLIYFKF